jgi:hypothetical protein
MVGCNEWVLNAVKVDVTMLIDTLTINLIFTLLLFLKFVGLIDRNIMWGIDVDIVKR